MHAPDSHAGDEMAVEDIASAFIATGVAIGQAAIEMLEAIALAPEVREALAARLELGSDDRRRRARSIAVVLAEVAVSIDRLELTWRS
jgi:hypothetical protein